jgi:hypothetical protein
MTAVIPVTASLEARESARTSATIREFPQRKWHPAENVLVRTTHGGATDVEFPHGTIPPGDMDCSTCSPNGPDGICSVAHIDVTSVCVIRSRPCAREEASLGRQKQSELKRAKPHGTSVVTRVTESSLDETAHECAERGQCIRAAKRSSILASRALLRRTPEFHRNATAAIRVRPELDANEPPGRQLP